MVFKFGSRFVASYESSAHDKFKQEIINANEGDTELTLKELTPVRMMKNNFYNKIQEAYAKNASTEQLSNLLEEVELKRNV